MRYFGGKVRISKELSGVIQKHLIGKDRFVDAFCGSMNIVSKINHPNRLANDINPYVLAVYEYALNGGELPDTVSEVEYVVAQLTKESFQDWYIGFVGFGCSFGAKFFGGYARDPKSDRNFAKEAKRSIIKKCETLKGVQFSNLDYWQLELKPTDLVYCDIPYEGTTGYSNGKFNHEEFYLWVSQQECTILVSEYKHNARLPIIWEKESKQDMKSKGGIRAKTTEVLMIHVPY